MYPPEFDRLLSEARALFGEQASLAREVPPADVEERVQRASLLLLSRACLQKVTAGVRQMQADTAVGRTWQKVEEPCPPLPETSDPGLQKLVNQAAALYQRYAEASDGGYKPQPDLKAEALTS